MSVEGDIREFLISRRAKITPDQVGLPALGGRRRVPGLRREEVATLAGISVEYYTQLERGDIRGVSFEVLDAVSRALRLDGAEKTHLAHLMRLLNAAPAPAHRASERRVPPSVRWTVDALASPAVVRNRRLDIVYANPLGYTFYAGAFRNDGKPANPARYVFLDRARAAEFFIDWEHAADDMVALLRAETGRNPGDAELADLIAELSAASEEFRRRWSAHDVLFHRTGVARFRHPIAGELTLAYQDLDIPTDPGLTILVFLAEPGSPSEEALRKLPVHAADMGTDARPS